MSRRLHSITGAVIATGKCPDTLRRLEDLGIVQPARDSANRRIYTDKDLETIRDYYRARQRPAAPSQR